MRKTTISILICCAASASGAWAAGQMKPGLWEMSVKSEAFKAMPKMSAQQMTEMRKMGIEIPQIQDGAMISKVCITKEMAESKHPPMASNDSGCEVKNSRTSGSSYSSDIVCNSDAMKGTGTVKGSFSSNTSFTSTYDFKGTMHGQPVSDHHASSGKWIAADCGAVKPIAEIPSKK